jgi:hypothetical protein
MTRILVAALAILAICSFGFSTSPAQTAGSGTGTDAYGSTTASPGTATGTSQTDPQTTPSTTSPTTTTEPTESSSSSTLPSTAGPWPMIALFGLGALGSGAVLRRVRR